MTLSEGEKLILVMLSDLYKHHKVKGNIDQELVLEAITRGQTWALRVEYPGLFEAEIGQNVVDETYDILDMWRILERSYGKLSSADKKRIEREADPFGTEVKFEGFDASHEPHYGVAKFLVEKLDKYSEFKGRDLDSHGRTIEPALRMQKVFGSVLKSLGAKSLTVEQIITILRAQKHPSGS